MIDIRYARPHRELCPEADERDAMDDGDFWDHVTQSLSDFGGATLVDVADDVDQDQLDAPPCPVCGSTGACMYDQEGRALIHSDDLDNDTEE